MVQPDQTDELYFVATGQGGHHFSKTLAEHDAALRVYLARLREEEQAAGAPAGGGQSMSRGLFITLEGIEGAGKSTVARAICEWLGGRGMRVVLTREPGGTPLAERVRQIVLERGEERLTAATETLLMFAARGIHVENLIRPALERGDCVVCDRFTDASRAYQGAGAGCRSGSGSSPWRARSRAACSRTARCCSTCPCPWVSSARAAATAGAADRFEAEAQAFFERVRAGYLELARREPERIHVIDAAVPLAAVERQVVAVLERLPLPGTGGRAP